MVPTATDLQRPGLPEQIDGALMMQRHRLYTHQKIGSRSINKIALDVFIFKNSGAWIEESGKLTNVTCGHVVITSSIAKWHLCGNSDAGGAIATDAGQGCATCRQLKAAAERGRVVTKCVAGKKNNKGRSDDCMSELRNLGWTRYYESRCKREGGSNGHRVRCPTYCGCACEASGATDCSEFSTSISPLGQDGCGAGEKGVQVELLVRFSGTSKLVTHERLAELDVRLTAPVRKASQPRGSGRLFKFDADFAAGNLLKPSTFYVHRKGDESPWKFAPSPRSPTDICVPPTPASPPACTDIAEPARCGGTTGCKYAAECGCIPSRCLCGDSCCVSGVCSGVRKGRGIESSEVCELFFASLQKESASSHLAKVRYPAVAGSDSYRHSFLLWLGSERDADGDGLSDQVEGPGDRDGDGLPNMLDLDSDNDGIPDELEGASDKDGDGLPNFLDDDSDGDGIPDQVEGMEMSCVTTGNDSNAPEGTPCHFPFEYDEMIFHQCTAHGYGTGRLWCSTSDVFSDPFSDGWGECLCGSSGILQDTLEDGSPDYLSEDSDLDGIADAIEGAVDSDRDGTLDFRDPDSDGDGIDDKQEGSNDFDGDGLANYRDTDSDQDGIPDAVEGTNDADGDGQANFIDLDSDGDSIPDSLEGVDDPDGDGLPNYLDDDSDGDGVCACVVQIVCVLEWVHVPLSLYMSVHQHTCLRIHTHIICTCVRMHIFIYEYIISTCMHACMRTYMHACMHT